MARSADGKAVWDLGDQQWSQDLKTGAFDLVDFKGLGAPAKRYHLQDLATLIGARVSVDWADRGRREAVLFPGQFKFSPINGKPLPDQPPGGEGAWVPPFGHDEGLVLGKPRGLRLTDVPLSLPPSLTHESRPHVELPLPPPGNYQFLVGSFTTHAAGLLAIEFSRGLLYRWLPAARSWQELLPGDRSILGESSLTDRTWGMTAPDPKESRQLFLPTDQGLAAVSLNLIAPDYRSKVVGTRCVGAPAVWRDGIYVPMQHADPGVAVLAFDPQTLEVIRRLEAPAAPDASEWTRPIVESRQIIWMSSAGQLLMKLRGETPEASFLPWEPGVIPRFDLGSPYVSADGHVWQQCFRDDASGGRFTFVQLGRPAPEVHPTSSPRLSTGFSSFQLETLLRANPWRDPDEGMDSQADEVIIPLLESLSRSTLLCARVPSTSAVDSVFSSDAPHVATFELRGEREVQFARERLTRPWLTRPFVYAGFLYLYHPDRSTLPGWRMS